MSVRTKYAISAFIDLLGFSSHLSLANNDIRTDIGEKAVLRLQNLDDVLNKIKKEEKEFKKCYPTVKIHHRRFNDAIFFTMDLSETLKTKIGETEWRTWEMNDLTDWMTKNEIPITKDNIVTHGKNELQTQYENVSKFVGLIARVHHTVNNLEHQGNFPGARTVISTGLKVVSETGKLDAFDANFSVANAYIVGESGKEKGFGGNNFYMEDSVAFIIKNIKTKYHLLSLANCQESKIKVDPFDINLNMDDFRLKNIKREYHKARQVSAELFGKHYNFRELNFKPLTWIPVFYYLAEYVNIIETKNEEIKSIALSFLDEPKSLDDVLASKNVSLFLRTTIPLSEDVLPKNFGRDIIKK